MKFSPQYLYNVTHFLFNNMLKQIQDGMSELGFDEKEISIYLALLKKGEITATKTSKETDIERTLVYYIIERLQQKGLVNYKLRNNVKYYSAADPKNILDDLHEKVEVYKKVLPLLKKLQSTTYEEEVTVDIYKGFQGLKVVMRDLLTGIKEILVLGEQGQAISAYPEYGNVYLHLLKKNNISEKVIAREDFRGKVPGWKKTQVRYLPKKSLSPTTTVIYQDKIIISIWEKPTYNILIKSKKISDSYRTYFSHLWKEAKK